MEYAIVLCAICGDNEYSHDEPDCGSSHWRYQEDAKGIVFSIYLILEFRIYKRLENIDEELYSSKIQLGK